MCIRSRLFGESGSRHFAEYGSSHFLLNPDPDILLNPDPVFLLNPYPAFRIKTLWGIQIQHFLLSPNPDPVDLATPHLTEPDITHNQYAHFFSFFLFRAAPKSTSVTEAALRELSPSPEPRNVSYHSLLTHFLTIKPSIFDRLNPRRIFWYLNYVLIACSLLRIFVIPLIILQNWKGSTAKSFVWGSTMMKKTH